MTTRTGWSVLASFLLLGCWMTALGQQAYRPQQRPPQRTSPAQPQAPPAPAAPFVLTAQQQARVDQVLRVWEERGAVVQRYECDFVRYTYKPAMARIPNAPNFGNPNRPFRVVAGKLKFAAPDKGRMEVIGELVGGSWANGRLNGADLIKGQAAELLICDGRSISEFDYSREVLRQYVLPPEMQGQAIVDGPLPFLFNAKAAKLKARYFIRITAEPTTERPEWLLEAWPRLQRDAADFFMAQIILDQKYMLPTAVQLHEPQLQQTTQGNRTAYELSRTKVNDSNLLDFLKGDPFKPRKPSGWTLERPPTQQASRPSSPGGVR